MQLIRSGKRLGMNGDMHCIAWNVHPSTSREWGKKRQLVSLRERMMLGDEALIDGDTHTIGASTEIKQLPDVACRATRLR